MRDAYWITLSQAQTMTTCLSNDVDYLVDSTFQRDLRSILTELGSFQARRDISDNKHVSKLSTMHFGEDRFPVYVSDDERKLIAAHPQLPIDIQQAFT